MDLRRLIAALDPDRLRAAFLNPRAHLAEVTLLLGVVVAAILLLTVVAALALTPPDHASNVMPGRVLSVAERARVRRRGRRTAGLIAAAVIVLVLIGTLVYTGRLDTCEGCHSKPDLVGAWKRSAHAKVQCFACHAAPGPLGAVAARSWVLGDVLRSQARISPLTRDAFVSNDTCVGCHAAALSGTVVVASVRMRHLEPLAAGASCVDCHAGVAHGRLVGARAKPEMAACLPCHDGTTASAKCGICHTEDVGAVRPTASGDIPQIQPLGKPKTCRGCHAVDSCNECHGLELPHTDAFKKGGHAMQAAFEKKKTCEKCHSVQVFCDQCHQFNADGTSPHNQPFRPVHATSLPACGCHGLSRQAMCLLCHGKTTGP